MGRLGGDYVKRVYAGWLGKVIGVRYGAPIEMWSHQRIASFFGELDGYVRSYEGFAADDDTNGPLFFIRALEDYDHTEALTPMQIGHTLLNYAPFEHGFFWWGGYGISAEHTVYLNLWHGVPAPLSGSIAFGGDIIPEQIGGQIFIDSWGFVVPGDYHKAARYARKAASIAWDREGIHGGMFVAACISAAFEDADIYSVLKKGLQVLPQDSGYAGMCRDIMAFYAENPSDWRACLAYIERHYWVDKYQGSCHIMPNAAIMVLSMLYGGGDFTRTLNICNMCGFDTDCNVGNVGAIMGVLVGLEGISYGKWRAEINDFQACSSVVGCLNITDLADSALYFARLGYLIAGEETPAEWAALMRTRGKRYHFELPGSTQSVRARMDQEAGGLLQVRNTDEAAYDGHRSLKVSTTDMVSGNALRAYVKTYYEKMDFDDARYEPTTSPILHPGQTLTAAVMPQPGNACALKACLYACDINHDRVHKSAFVDLVDGEWTTLRYDIPAMGDACLKEAGVWVEPREVVRFGVTAGIFLDDLAWGGNVSYGIDFAAERNWSWAPKPLRNEISQFTRLKGAWQLDGGKLHGHCSDFGEAYTGDVAWRDYTYTAQMEPCVGDTHMLLFRVQGAMRSYALCLGEGQTLRLLKNDHGTYIPLAETAFAWEAHQTYRFVIAVQGNQITAEGPGVTLSYVDDDGPYLHGMIGAGIRQGSHCAFDGIYVKQDEQWG